MDNQETHRYDDIINLPHPTSKTHPRMPLYNRATQFSPFAALTGHDAAIAETARRTDEKHQLSEDTIAELNEKLNLIAETIGTKQTVTTENDACNGVAMLFGHLLSGCGQMFSDIRTYWSPEPARSPPRAACRPARRPAWA